MKPRVYYGVQLARYSFGHNHPFGPDRLQAFWQETLDQHLHNKIAIAEPRLCDESALTLFHTRNYIDRVIELSKSGQGFLDHGDTPSFKGIYDAARYVVGSVLDGLDALMQNKARHCFIPIAGLHHARPDSAAGFCVFNDIGVAIEHARRLYGLACIAYVDIDAHHGDGVFYSYENDAELIFADLHEDGHYLYPGTGSAGETGIGQAAGTKLNIPMPPHADDGLFLQAWDKAEDFLRQFKPELIIFQAGADSLAGDPITHLQYSHASHAHATKRLCVLAEECCDGRLLALGGGGYNRRNLALAWNAVVSNLVDHAAGKT